MKVCIAEKPSVAKEIAHILGANQRNNGYFEGNGYQVTWTFGHLCTLYEPEDYNQILKYWNIDNLPIIPEKYDIKLIDNKGVKEQFETIKKLFSTADEIINCGDAGQEGELIQRWVFKLAGCGDKPIKRLWISSLTEEAIREGFSKLKDSSQYDKLFYAGSSRAIGDWLLGMNATRLYTKKYAPKGTVLSIGRVQTPTLAMIVARHKEIEAFNTEDFWELKTKYKEVLFSSDKGKIKNVEEANSFIQSIEQEAFTVTSFEKKEGKESAPKLYDLTSLQVECNKKLNLGADETLKIAQTLYEKKFLTYPRVDTRYLPLDIYPKIEGVLKALTGFTAYTEALLGKEIRKSKNVFDNEKVTDHHAIIPTNQIAANLAPIERQVYDMVAQRFIANFLDDCIVSKTTVIGQVKDIEFKATGRQILEAGWRTVYGVEEIDEDDKKKDEDDTNQIMPIFEKGETGTHVPLLEQKQSSPPKPYTEATLLRAMETAGKQIDDEDLRELMKENGIGRPSTRANIIQTLFKRQYISKSRKSIIPTSTGIQLIDTIKHDMLKSAELTGRWEKNLQDIEKGKYSVKQFLHEMNQFVREVVMQVKFDHAGSTFIVEKEPEKGAKKEKATDPNTCPKCKKGTIMQGKFAYGCSEFKNNCDFRIPMQLSNISISLKQVNELVSKNKTGLVKGFEMGSEKKSGHFFLNKNFNIEFKEAEEAEWKCPKCKTGDIIKGKQAYGCNQYQQGCRFMIPFTYAGKKLTEKQIETLLVKGRTNLIKGFEHKGEQFDGRITINKTDDLEFQKA